MPTKKPAHEKKPAAATARRARLTSALGPKPTTMLVIAVLTGGLVVGELQHSEQMAKDREAAMRVGTSGSAATMTPVPQSKKAAVKPSSAVTPASAPAETPKMASLVTIAGCLERNDEAFRLKDTEGTSAPKARSWKSGFLKKGSAPINVVDAARGVPLADHVGRRVSVTGTLDGRDMQARSVRRLSSSCS
jgi:hypothetical protein